MEDTATELPSEKMMSFPLYVCAKEITRQYSVYLDPFNLTYTQYIAMRILWKKKKVTVSDLGKELYLDSGTLTPLLKKLEAKGYVKKIRSKEDERKVIVSPTKQGLELEEKVAHIPSLVGSHLEVSDEERMALQSLINHLMGQIMEAGKEIRLKKAD